MSFLWLTFKLWDHMYFLMSIFHLIFLSYRLKVLCCALFYADLLSFFLILQTSWATLMWNSRIWCLIYHKCDSLCCIIAWWECVTAAGFDYINSSWVCISSFASISRNLKGDWALFANLILGAEAGSSDSFSYWMLLYLIDDSKGLFLALRF